MTTTGTTDVVTTMVATTMMRSTTEMTDSDD
jgi:hypothetical protein